MLRDNMSLLLSLIAFQDCLSTKMPLLTELLDQYGAPPGRQGPALIASRPRCAGGNDCSAANRAGSGTWRLTPRAWQASRERSWLPNRTPAPRPPFEPTSPG